MHVLEKQLGGVGRIHAELFQLAPAAEALRVVGLDHKKRGALRAGFRISFCDNDDQVGVLAIGDECLRTVEHIAVARFLGGRAHALQIGAGARLGHRDRANEFAGGKFRQPPFLLLFGAVMQNVGRDDARVQRRAECVEPGERELAVDHRLMGERSAGTAIFLRHGGAKESGLAGFGPHVAIVNAGFVPAVKVRDKLVGDVASRLLLEQHEIFGHPVRPRQVESVHRATRLSCTIRPAAHAREGSAARRRLTFAAQFTATLPDP